MNTRTHYDYLEEIGTTTEDFSTLREKNWNRFYYKTFLHHVNSMLGENTEGKSIIDIGTSRGRWLSFFKQKGFNPIIGVEVDPGRAAKAQERGYDAVHNCDAANIPVESASIDFAISNGVFVHILQIKDKIDVLKEAQRILRPGGSFIFNHTMSVAYGSSSFFVKEYCSFMRLDEVISLIMTHTKFKILDIKPTFFHFRNTKPDNVTSLMRKGMLLPFAFIGDMLFERNRAQSSNYPLEESDTVYFKLVK